MSGIAKRRYRNGSEYAKWGVEGLIENKEGIDEGMEGLDETKDMWGWTEEMGWRQDEEVGLKELGEVAEESYMLHVAPGEAGLEECAIPPFVLLINGTILAFCQNTG